MLNIESMNHNSCFDVLLYLTCRHSQRQFLLAALKIKQCINYTFQFLCRSHNFFVETGHFKYNDIPLPAMCNDIHSLFVNKDWILSNIYFIVRHIVDKLSYFLKFAFSWQIIVQSLFHMFIVYLHFLFYELPVYIIIICPFLSVGSLSCIHFTLQLKWSVKNQDYNPISQLPGWEFLS